MLLSNDGHTTRMLQTLKDCGFALALDDFGTGYSSLAYIRDFPFDRLKIDRSFVHGLQEFSERALAIIEAVANFGRILGKDVVAEGIETEQEMQAMQKRRLHPSAGLSLLQGPPRRADRGDGRARPAQRDPQRPGGERWSARPGRRAKSRRGRSRRGGAGGGGA